MLVSSKGESEMDLGRGGVAPMGVYFCEKAAVLDMLLISGPNTLSYASFFNILDLFSMWD